MKIVLSLLVGAFFAQAANATVIQQCNAMSGKAFYAQDGHWIDDKISNSNYIFEKSSDGKWDIIYRDATGKMKSVKDESGLIFQFSDDSDPLFMLGVAYPGYKQFEVYQIAQMPDGKRSLLYSANKGGTYSGQDMTKISAMIATCEK